MAASYEECFGDQVFELPSRAVTAGGQHSCALRVDGTAWCWGDNTSDQLGVPWALDHSADPVQVTETLEPGLVTPMQDVVSISAGDAHTCAVRGDGTVWCWGSNEWGQLGIATTTTQSDAPRLVVDVLGEGKPLSGVEQVSAGFAHTCVVQRKDQRREVLCWGANFTGQLGYSIGQGHYWPERVSELPEAEKVSAGYLHTCTVGVDGSVWCWGNNSQGQLGAGHTSDRNFPSMVIWQ
jgi:alpha-tubulin suppressor-like RCC1 family protein